MEKLDLLFIVEMSLFSGVAILFGVREIWKLTPKQIAKDEARALLRAQRYEKEEALRAAARHAKR